MATSVVRSATSIANRARPISYRDPIRKDLLAYTPGRSALVESGLNDQEMSAPFIISTNDEDREADIIEPDGILEHLHEYKSNPIVLFDHEQHKVVGSSEGPDRQLYLAVRPTEIWAKCFFHDCLWENIPIGQETYHLVKKRIFRGASIGFLPIKVVKRGYGKDAGNHYKKIRLTEWSICPLQSNQNALSEFRDELRACLDRGEIVCKSFGASLRKTYLPPPPVWSPGWSHDLSTTPKGQSMVAVRIVKGGKRSPKGGITIGGKFYRGGLFIPAEVLAKATASEKAKLGGQPNEIWEDLGEGPWDTAQDAIDYGNAEVGVKWDLDQRPDGKFGLRVVPDQPAGPNTAARLEAFQAMNESWPGSPEYEAAKQRYVDAKQGKSMSKRIKAAVTCQKSVFGTREECRKSLGSRGYVPVGDAIDNGDSWTFPIVPDFDGSFDGTKAITKGMAALLVKKPKPFKKGEEADETDDDVPDEGKTADGKTDDAAADDDDATDDDDSALEPNDDEAGIGAGTGSLNANDAANDAADAETDDVEGKGGAGADHTMKVGAHTLAEHLAHHEAIVNSHDDRMNRNESPEVQQLLEESKSMAEGMMTKIHALAKKLFPGLDLNDLADSYRPEAAGAMDGTAENAGDDDEDVGGDTGGDLDLEEGDDDDDIPTPPKKKSLKKHGGKVKAAAEFLEDLNGSAKVHKSLHSSCAMHAKCLGEITKDLGEEEGGEEAGGEDDEMVEKTLNLAQQVERQVTELNAKLARLGG